MKQSRLLSTVFATLLASPSVAYALPEGEVRNNEYVVKVKRQNEYYAEGNGGIEDVQEVISPNMTGDNLGAAVKYIRFDDPTGPNRAPIAKGQSIDYGSYCLTNKHTLGVLSMVPPDWAEGGGDTPYLRKDDTYMGCVSLSKDQLEAAGIELAEVDGQPTYRSVRISLTVTDFETFPVLATPVFQQNAPHTLKNYHTNFWVDPSPQEFTRDMAGRQVRVRAVPVSYTYWYGDGQSYSTTHPGYRLADDVWDEPTPTSYQYRRAGDYELRVQTSFRGEFSVDGGPWQVIEGLVSRVSDPLLVRVWRAEVGLVAEDCLVNPSGWGCPGVG